MITVIMKSRRNGPQLSSRHDDDDDDDDDDGVSIRLLISCLMSTRTGLGSNVP